MSISKKHPVCNFLRIEPHEHRKALDRVLQFRDESDDRMASGMPPAAEEWFWAEELPRLINRPDVRLQVEARRAELQHRLGELTDDLHRLAGSLIEEQSACQEQLVLLDGVLG
jgi:hypothetical protein